ncbi:MAG TPA: PilZ domain-containing protein [Phycisphaerae bacterium]|nr:PilZ domain-containing protein [Phycisphaerae bacterium]
MQTEQIVRITRRRVADLVKSRERSEDAVLFTGDEKRRNRRWPFPGAAELSLADGDGRKRWFATCGNLSFGGLGIITDRHFSPGTVLDISCHLPELTMVGRVTVLHCRPAGKGFLTGVRFDFDE